MKTLQQHFNVESVPGPNQSVALRLMDKSTGKLDAIVYAANIDQAVAFAERLVANAALAQRDAQIAELADRLKVSMQNETTLRDENARLLKRLGAESKAVTEEQQTRSRAPSAVATPPHAQATPAKAALTNKPVALASK